jgi:hypothetical protein
VALTAAVVTMSTAISTASSADPTTGAGAPPAAPVTVTLRNTCDFPVGGPQVITVELTALLPDAAGEQDPVVLSAVSVKFALPEAMIKALRDSGVASVEGVAAVSVDADKQATRAGATIAKTPLPETGDLLLDVPAKVTPEIKAAKAGTLTLTAGPLETLLMSRDAAGEGSADVRKVTCELEKGQETKLGAVKITPKPAKTTTSPDPSPSASAGQTSKAAVPPREDGNKGPGKNTGKGKARVRDEPAQGCGPQPPDAFTFWTYYPLTGHATVKKLNSSIDFGPPGYMSAQLAFWFDPETFAQCNGLVGDLLWPPARGKFTAFRFVPTEATVTITQTKPTVGVLDGNGNFIGTAETNMRMTDATVNGTPLPVGTTCATSTPVVLNLHSKEGEWNPVADPAGFMEADFTIPSFAGCGVTEDLDPLFNGLVSGPGNHLRLDFGNVVFCTDVPPDFDGSKPCAPQLPAGRR